MNSTPFTLVESLELSRLLNLSFATLEGIHLKVELLPIPIKKVKSKWSQVPTVGSA